MIIISKIFVSVAWLIPGRPHRWAKMLKAERLAMLRFTAANKAHKADPQIDADLEAKEILLMEDPICGKHHF